MFVKAKYYHWGNPGINPEWEDIEWTKKEKKNFRKLGPIALEGFDIAAEDKDLVFIADKLSIDTIQQKKSGIGVKHAYGLKSLPAFFSDLEETD